MFLFFLLVVFRSKLPSQSLVLVFASWNFLMLEQKTRSAFLYWFFKSLRPSQGFLINIHLIPVFKSFYINGNISIAIDFKWILGRRLWGGVDRCGVGRHAVAVVRLRVGHGDDVGDHTDDVKDQEDDAQDLDIMNCRRIKLLMSKSFLLIITLKINILKAILSQLFGYWLSLEGKKFQFL